MKINFKKLFLSILIAFLIGNLFAIFIMTNSTYEDLNKAIEVPGIVFPIVWSILYLIMGITSYVISNSYSLDKSDALKIYFIQLFVNSLWTLIFFGFKLYVLSFVWIILLIFLVIIMIYKFYKIKPICGYLNIPYLLWLLFASFLSLSIVILN